jgi:hypothetical protein
VATPQIGKFSPRKKTFVGEREGSPTYDTKLDLISTNLKTGFVEFGKQTTRRENFRVNLGDFDNSNVNYT